MKKISFFLAIFILLIVLSKGAIDLFWNRPIHHIKSFSIFYGEPTQQKLEELRKKDAVILEPIAFSEQDISFLKKSDVKLFGYVSLMQLENWNEELKKQISDSDYASIDGERIYIKDWQTYVMDVRESHYRQALLWKIKTYIVDQGLDGIFFDTVDDLDYYFHQHQQIQVEMRAGYVTLLKEIDTQYPGLMIIQNRGFETLESVSHPFVDALLWEGFKAKDIKESQWAKNWLHYLKKEQWKRRIQVFTVVSDDESYNLSKKYRFPAYRRVGDTYQD